MSESNGTSEPKANNSSSIMGFSSSLAAAIMRQISLPKFLSASGSTSSISIDQIKLGSATVDHVDIQDVDTQVDTGEIIMEDARAVVSLKIFFEYGIHIPLPLIRDINIDGNITIGTIRFPFDIGDISIPALNDIDLDIPSATLKDIQASLEPVENLELGSGSFNGLMLDDTVLPAAGFALGGLSLGTAKLSNVSIPSVSSARLSLDEFSPDSPLVLPSISVKDIQLPSASAPNVSSDGPIVVPEVSSESQEIPLITRGPLQASITIEPTLTIAIRSMVINDISAISSIKKIDLRDMQSSVQLSGISLEGLELNSVKVESVSTIG